MAKYSPSLPNILGYICQIPASTEGITYTRIFASVTTSTNLKQNEAHSARAESTHPWIVVPANTEGITLHHQHRICASVTTSTNLKQNAAHSTCAESTHPWIVVPASAEGITDTKIHVSVMTSTNPKHAAWFQNLWVKINIYLKNHSLDTNWNK